MITISEKFLSIQGEGFNAGIPSMFIRFNRCNLKCPYCDSKQAWKNKGDLFDSKYIEEFLKELKISNINNVVITGGEPLLNYKTDIFKEFISILLNEKKSIDIETTFLFTKNDILDKSIQTNIFELLKEWGSSVVNRINFSVSPKLSIESYKPLDVKQEDIVEFYLFDKYFYEHELSHMNLIYKPIYFETDKIILNTLLKNLPGDFSKKNLFVMPYTPMPYNRLTYTQSCRNTWNFCLENNYRYGVRIHIDLWNDMKCI